MVQLYAGALIYRLLMQRRMMQLMITMVMMIVMMMVRMMMMMMMMIKSISSYLDRPLLGVDEPGREGKTQDK